MALSNEDRRAAKAAWRERGADWTICALRIGDAVWLKSVPDAGAFERRIGFSLRSGGPAAPGMAAAYARAGAVTVEVVERLDPELSDMARETLLETRLADWAERLGARRF